MISLTHMYREVVELSLPFTDIFIIDCILMLMYIVAGILLAGLAVFVLCFIGYVLIVTSIVWLPIMIIVVLLCNIFGIGIGWY